jgi:peptidoglycan/LPS O-acetylase OafA/YrhL
VNGCFPGDATGQIFGAVDVGIDQCLHFSRLQPYIPANPGDVLLEPNHFPIQAQARYVRQSPARQVAAGAARPPGAKLQAVTAIMRARHLTASGVPEDRRGAEAPDLKVYGPARGPRGPPLAPYPQRKSRPEGDWCGFTRSGCAGRFWAEMHGQVSALNQQTTYRPDIDGLRAVAVLSVLAYHLGVVGFPGGFVGVDVFFVISGYLIASQIYSETTEGTFSILQFYERRARRILPALFATIIASATAAVSILYPSELVEFARSGIASSLFAANIYFYLVSDYFGPAASTVPLLHLWSLGIEEQFYILFPLLVWAGAKSVRRRQAFVLTILCVASLGFSQFLAMTHPVAAFYLPFGRAFELLIGCLLAFSTVPKPRSTAMATGVWLVGASAVVVAIASFDVGTRFPGIAALLPCLGAAAMIWAGPAAAVSQLLELRPVVYVGKISYSLYLVHWPILVFGKRLFPYYFDTWSFTIAATLLTVLLAAISYEWVEQPFRRRSWGKNRTAKVLGVSATSIFAIVILGAWTVHESGFQANTDQRIKRALAFLQFDLKPMFRSGVCFLDPDQQMRDLDLTQCLPEKTKAVLWGDSYAAALYLGIRDALAPRGISLGQLTASACAPIVGREAPLRPHCKSFNDDALPLLVTRKPGLVILAASWPTDRSAMEYLDQTTAALVSAGIKVVVLGSLPIYKMSVPTLLARRIHDNTADRMSADDIEINYMHASDAALSERRNNEVRFISIFATICPGERCPLEASEDTPMQFDIAHLTDVGSHYFAKRLMPLIDH